MAAGGGDVLHDFRPARLLEPVNVRLCRKAHEFARFPVAVALVGIYADHEIRSRRATRAQHAGGVGDERMDRVEAPQRELRRDLVRACGEGRVIGLIDREL